MACRPDLTALEEVSLGGSVAELMAINFWLSERGGRLLQSLVACTPQRPLVMESGCRQCSQQVRKMEFNHRYTIDYSMTLQTILYPYFMAFIYPCLCPSSVSVCHLFLSTVSTFLALYDTFTFITLHISSRLDLICLTLRDYVSTCLFAVNQSTNQPACGSKGE